jgi:Tfp pilus assembly protein PilO
MSMMILSKREQRIAVISAVGLVLLVLYYMVLSPYLDERDSNASRSTELNQKVSDANAIFDRERHLRKVWQEMQQGLNVDASTAESQAQQAVIDYADASGVTLTGLRPGKTSPGEDNFQIISFNVSGTGAMPDIARMLWALESSWIPVRVSDIQLKPRKEGTDDLLAQFTLSALCLPPGSPESDHALTSASASNRDITP